jgi:hypothetical protein
MGLFGGDRKTYTASTTKLTQEDKSVAAAGDAENIIGSGGRLTQASNSTIVESPNTTSGDIILNQFPEAVQNTLGSLIKSVDTSVKTVGEAFTTQQIGGESQLPKIVLYMMVGLGVMLFASRMFKK